LNGDFLTLVVSHTRGNDVSFKSSEASSGKPELTVTFTTNSIKTLDQENVLMAYPNPATNELFVNGLTKNSSISIFDMTGKSVTIEKMISDQKKMRLDISDFETGIYFIKVNNGREDKDYSFYETIIFVNLFN